MAIDGQEWGPKLTQFLNETGMGNHPLLVKLFHSMAMKTGEDKLIMSAGPSESDRQTAGERIRAIRGDKDHPFNNPKNPAHMDAVRHMQSLYETMNAKDE
jgi:hypothetical protein